jgi:predicted amidohydrolase YtcJ
VNFGIQNARIYTGDESQPWAEAAVVRDGRFAFVGSAAGWDGSEPVEFHDLAGAVVLPGLIDSHTHPASVASSRWHVTLPRTDDAGELLAFIRQYGQSHPAAEAPFLYFEYYYINTTFPAGAPTKELLDGAISDRPVLVQESSDHSSWANSRMFEALGVTRDTPDPEPGLVMFQRDDSGEPAGLIFETAWRHYAETMWQTLGWRPPEGVTVENLRPVLQFLKDHGVTALFDAVLADEDTLRAVADLDARGELGLYYQGAPRFNSLAELPETLATVRRYQEQYGSARIRVQAVKFFLDGTNEIGNCAVLDPLASGRHDHGAIRMDTGELTECLLLCNAAEVDLHVHMVGDRAFRTGCDAVQAAQARAAAEGSPWRIQVTFAHCELVDPADMGRPAELGIIVNWTTHWSGGYFGEEARHHLGDERWNRMYAFNEMAASGAVLTFSSDVVTQYELHRANPFFGLQVARTRVDPEVPLDPRRYPGSVRPQASSAVPLELLLRGYTIDGARQLRLEDQIGSITAGKTANFVVLSEDLFAAEDARLSEVRPTAVIFEGDLVSGTL